MAIVCLMVSAVSAQEGGKSKLVLEKITYEKPAFKSLLAGGDQLLLEKLVHARKYRVIDRDAVDAYLREKGIAGDDGAGLASGDRTLYVHVADCTSTGKYKVLPGNKKAQEYIVRLSLKICKMEETLDVEVIENERIEAVCVSKVDLLDEVISRLARKAIFAIDFANPEITDVADGDVEVNYGKGFMAVGEIYDIYTGAKGLRGRRPVGQIQITEVDKDCSVAKILSGDIQIGYKLKIVDKKDVGNGGGMEADPNATAPNRIVCVVSNFGFAPDFKGTGYEKKSVFPTIFDVGAGIKDGVKEAKKNKGRRSQNLAKLVITAVPEATDALFGDGISVNYTFKTKMKTNQEQMLKAALSNHPRFDVREYKVARHNLDAVLARGVTHVIDGSIRGVHINKATGKTTFIFALKLVDISNNNTIVSNQDRIVVECNGYEEPDTYEEATKKAVAQFATTF